MPEFNLLAVVVTIVGVMAIVLGVVAYLVLAERKISAYMQDRIGPNRVGPAGVIQPLVDGIKMMLKEDIVPSHVDKLFYFLAPAIAAGTALLAFAVIPFGPSHIPPGPVPVSVDTSVETARATYFAQQEQYRSVTTFAIAPGVDIGILFVFAIGSLAVYGIVLGGWSANNKYSMLGALRSSAQIISYEIPMGMAVVSVFLVTGSLNLERIIDHQVTHGWNILYQPLAFVMFMTAIYAECNRLPFDLPEAEQELVGGYHTEYSSMKFGLFFLGEYTHMITTSFLLTIMFLGGWHFPGLDVINSPVTMGLAFAVMFAKVAFFIALFMFVRWTIPRFRFDQLMGLAWMVLIPLSIINLLCVMILKEFQLPLGLMFPISFALFAASALLSTRQGVTVPVRPPHPLIGAGSR